MGGRGGAGPSADEVRSRLDANAAVDVEGALVKALRRASRGKPPGSWIDIAVIRESMPAVQRSAFDDALRKLLRARRVFVIPEENQQTLTPRRREAAIQFGNEPNHLIRLGSQ